MHSYYQDNSEKNPFAEERELYLRRKFSRLSLAFVIGVLATYLSVMLIQLIVSASEGAQMLSQSIYWQWAVSLLPLYLFGMPATFFFLWRMEVVTPTKKSLLLGEFLLLFLIGRFFTLVGTYISNFLVAISERILGSPIKDATSALIEATPPWLIFLAAVIIAPILEELFYRKLIIDRLYMHGEAVAILFSSLIFALAHGNLYQVAYAFLNALILGLIYTRTGRLRYSIAFHMATNFLGSILVLPVLDAQTRLQAFVGGGEMGAEYIQLSMLVGGYGITKIFLAILGVAVLCFTYKQFLPKRGAIDPLPRKNAYRIVALNPGFIAFLAVSALEFVLSLSQ